MTAPTDFIDVPSGALCGTSVTLTCKGPDEERSYFLEYDSQLDPDDYITGVTAVAGDAALAITGITVLGRQFRFTISGGTLNLKSGIEFTMTLKSGDIRTLICVVSIEAQGVLQTGTVPVIMGAQGARGTQIWFSEVDPTSSFIPPNNVAVNSGDIVYSQASNAFFVASYVSGVLTWTKTAAFVTTVDADSVIITKDNNVSIGDVADYAVASHAVTDFFQVTNGRLCLIRSKLHTSPSENGEIYDPGQGILYINYEG